MVDLLVRRDLSETKLVTPPPKELAAGEIELAVDHFALTANNVTYGAIGDMFGYWRFFPTDEEGWGRIPVWGFGTVARSLHPEVKVGERFYGYFPMSSEIVLRPDRVTRRGLSDGAEHRAGLPAVYNDYRRVGAPSDHDAFEMLLRPLFATAFVLDDFLAESAFFGARAVIFSSASSKTAYGTAFLLAERKKQGADLEIVGLTSTRNVAFVEGLGIYDRVLAYERLEELPIADAVFVDVAGDGSVRARLHHHLGDRLKHSAALGFTHWEATRTTETLAGPAPTLFFAPEHMKRRLEQWGPAAFQERAAKSWTTLLRLVEDPSKRTLRIVRSEGPDATRRVLAALLAGQVPPEEGHILSLRTGSTSTTG